MTETTTLLISQIRTDGATQPRAELNYEVIEEYSQAMRAGSVFPPVDVFYDGTDYWLADGFHRLAAAGGAELARISVVVHQGTRKQAEWFSFTVNKDHGLRRSAADVKRIIGCALIHENAANMSDNAVAKHIGCSHSWVSEIHRSIFAASAKIEPESPKKRTVTRAGVTYQQNVANIGLKSTSRRPQSHQKVNEGDGAPTPVTEAGSPAITVCPSTGEADRPKPRTYHPDPAAQELPVDPIAPQRALEGLEAAIKLITSARDIMRANLSEKDYDYLSVDIPGIRLLEQAGEALLEHARRAKRLMAEESKPAERVAIH